MKRNLRFTVFFAAMMAALLTLNPQARAADPQNVTVCEGYASTVSFTVGTVIGTFQWQGYNKSLRKWENLFNTSTGVTISGATTATVTFGFSKLYPVDYSIHNGLQVRCAITTKLGTSYTNAASLIVLLPASITGNPASATKIVGEAVTFTVTASGSSVNYQWQLDKGSGYSNISGATSNSYSISAVALSNAGTYRCMVSNTCKTVYSTGAVLTVWDVLAITKDPADVAACEGTTGKSFSVTAKGNITAYQWQSLPYKSITWQNISGATSSTYNLPALTTPMDRYAFRCVVTGNGGQTVTSNSALLTVYSNVSISAGPSSATKTVGESVTFSVSSSGSNRTFQWQVNKGSGFSNISGATSSSYTIGSVALTDAGSYRCVVTGTCNSVTSGSATLTVNPAITADAWYLQSTPTSKDITKISTVSENVAWGVLSDYDKMLKTTNGGTDWTVVSTGLSSAQYTYWYTIDFVTSDLGFVAGYNRIAKTSNAGANWTDYELKTNLPTSDFPYVWDIQMVNSTTGYAVGSGGLIIKTTNGGTNWAIQNYHNVGTPVTDAVLRSVYFLDANNGYAAGENGVILKTTNGGTTWTKPTSPVTWTLQDIEFANSTIGFAVAPNGILKTTNGGTNWSTVTGLPQVYPYGLDFVDANNGYMYGYYWSGSTQTGTILKTNDGGANWYRQRMEGANTVFHIEMANLNHGYAFGDAGQVHRTVKGGCLTPKVNLYADQEWCAGTSIQLVADTFANNLSPNCKYLWTPGNQTTGKLTVTTTDTYGVTVTNECGMTASDNVVVTFNAKPSINAGTDVVICAGENTQLLATGGISYSWNNGSSLNNNAIPNPIATPSSTTTYIVTGTDEKGCSNTDDVKVTVNPIPSSAFTAPTFVCDESTGTFTYSGGSGAGKSFTWDFDGGNIQTGAGVGPYTVKWTELGNKDVSLTVVQDGCVSPVTTKQVDIRLTPTSTFDIPASVCGNNAATFFYTGNAPGEATYNWGIGGGTLLSGSGQGPVQVGWATGGTKNVSLSVTNNGCNSSTTNKSILVSYPYEGEEICMITIDLETGKNMVVWEKTPDVGIASYNVYREKIDQQGVFEVIGNVPASEISLFVDLTSMPENRQYLYKISAIDTCGNESSLSKWHKTMFLQYVSTTGGVNLNWQDYQVESGSMNFTGYTIFKGSDSTKLAEFTTISSSLKAYTDTDPTALTKRTFYRIGGVKPQACDPAGIGKKAGSGPFIYSLSNLDDNKLKTDVSNVLALNINLRVYPNPYKDVAYISYHLPKANEVHVEVYNILGERVAMLEKSFQDAGDHRLELKASDLNDQSGLYYVKVYVGTAAAVQKVMLMK